MNLLNEDIKRLNELLSGSVDDDTVSLSIEGSFQDVFNIVQKMIYSKFKPAEEPFLQCINKAIFCRSLKDIITRERILVKRSGCLLGIMDETGILEYGQVFCRLSKSNDPNKAQGDEMLKDGNFVITGPVVVTKNPCLFPGDVLVLNAIDLPELYHYINVVVFPSKEIGRAHV